MTRRTLLRLKVVQVFKDYIAGFVRNNSRIIDLKIVLNSNL